MVIERRGVARPMQCRARYTKWLHGVVERGRGWGVRAAEGVRSGRSRALCEVQMVFERDLQVQVEI